MNLFYKLKPDLFFLCCSAVFGLILLIVTPPFQTPDEFNHFYRAYQISEGNFVAIKKDNRVGGELPESLVRLTQSFRNMPRREYITTTWTDISDQFDIPLVQDRKVFVDFPNTGMYSFVSYAPQAMGIFVLRVFDLPPLYLFYGARLASLIFWIFSIAFAIRRLPFYQWLFVLLALLPMSVSTNMSVSADVVTNVLAFVVIAYSLDLAYKQPVVSLRHVLVYIVWGILLALAKVVYIPLILLFLLIPHRKFASTRAHYFTIVLVFAGSAIAAISWSVVMGNLYVPYSLYNPAFRDGPIMATCLVPCANMQDQLHYIMSDWTYVPVVFIHSIKASFDMYFEGYIGTFGWLETTLSIGFIYFSYGIIFLVALWDGSSSFQTGRYFKPMLIGSFTVVIVLLLLTQLLTWVCVGGDWIYIIQGRYIIPVMPLLFMLCYNVKWSRPQVVIKVVSVFSVLSLSYTSAFVYQRYFDQDEVEIIRFSTDVEKVHETYYLTTDRADVYLENGNTQSDEKARSGKYSVKVSFKQPYSLTYRLRECKAGDSLLVDVYRYGSKGGIMISGGENSFYTYTDDPIEKDSLGWDHLQKKFLVPHNMGEKQLSIFAYYKEGDDSSYFDDLRFTYRKLK
ncbi:MAG: Protein of unknown function rane [Cytophagaceae bacterium]|jgi:uncharacterized membrane protein|nr:Protein of unknown function rane [Cytophagaceae bacterium]